jgi:hypothetical protein
VRRAASSSVCRRPAGSSTAANRDHQERWIKTPGTRDDAHRPAYVHDAIHLRDETPRRQHKTLAEGDFVISAWDSVFADNFGFYRLHVLMKRGDGQLPGPVE